jgi:GT2 family glycosyltransferase
MTKAVGLSVIIPTFNGGWVLQRTMEAIRAQEVPAGTHEIIVVDDGSTDGSIDGLEQWNGAAPLRLLQQPQRGRAAARNLGASEAAGHALLFLDADVWAEPGLVAAHLAHHGEGKLVGVQGRWQEHPDTLNSLFMRARNLIPDTTRRKRVGLSPYHVVTRNFSIHADAFRQCGGFDEAFRGYGWEDIELAFRLVEAGVELRYEPAAASYHYQRQTLDELREKMRQAGEGAVYFWEKHHRDRQVGFFLEILPVMLPLKWLVYRSGLFTAALRPVLALAERADMPLVANEVYSHLLWRSFYEGVFATLRRESRRRA